MHLYDVHSSFFWTRRLETTVCRAVFTVGCEQMNKVYPRQVIRLLFDLGGRSSSRVLVGHTDTAGAGGKQQIHVNNVRVVSNKLNLRQRRARTKRPLETTITTGTFFQTWNGYSMQYTHD